MSPKHAWSALMLVVCLCVSASCASSAATAPKPDATVLAAAQRWMTQIDAGDYQGSWERASALFQAAIDAPSWTESASAARSSYGVVRTRELSGSQYTTKIVGIPEGEYWVLQFRTMFANEQRAIETVTLERQGNAWRGSGYFIR